MVHALHPRRFSSSAGEGWGVGGGKPHGINEERHSERLASPGYGNP